MAESRCGTQDGGLAEAQRAATRRGDRDARRVEGAGGDVAVRAAQGVRLCLQFGVALAELLSLRDDVLRAARQRVSASVALPRAETFAAEAWPLLPTPSLTAFR